MLEMRYRKCDFEGYLTALHFLYLPLAASDGVTALAQEAKINMMIQKRINLNKSNCFEDIDVDIGLQLWSKTKLF
jgi:hypothetical protein